MRRLALLYIIAVALTLSIRLYPTFVSGEPFSIDAWPLLYDAKIIRGASPIPLEDGRLDGYNSFWPGSIFTSVITSIVLGLDIEALMAVLYPLVNGLGTALYIYLIGRRLGGYRVGLTASLLAGLMYPAFFMGAGVTKETYTYTLYLALIYLSIFIMGWVKTLPIILLAFGAVLSHHLTAFIIFASLLTIGILYILKASVKGATPLLAAATIFIIGYIHYNLLGYLGLRLPELVPETLVSMGAYLIIFLFIGYIHPGDAKHGFRLIMNIVLLGAILSILAFGVLTLGLSMEAPKLGVEYLPYTFQYILVGILAYISTTRLGGDGSGKGIYYWFLGVAWIIVYALFGGNPFFLNIIYRFINFLIPPLTILAAYTLMKKWSRVGALALSITIILVGVSSTYMLVGAFHFGDPYLGYNWRNRVGVIQPGEYLEVFTEQNMTNLYGDSTIKYIYNDYYGFKVYTQPNNLMDPESTGRGLAIMYREMLINGFNQGPYRLIKISEKPLRNNLNRLYDNNELWIYG